MKRQLNDEQNLRYCRHILIPDFEEEGQEALLNAKVLIIGVGGLGCAAAQYLASSGVGKLTLVDDDRVDKTNLQRQILHREAMVGELKVESAKQLLSEINSAICIETISQRLKGNALTKAIATHDLVLDCCDNLKTRQAVNRICHQHRVPLVSGAATRCEGQVSSFSMQPETPCYQCMSRYFDGKKLSCMEPGVLAPVVGIIGATQAAEAIKLLSGFGEPLIGKILLLDAKSMQWRRFSLDPDPGCEVCAAVSE